jgi:hypothetical protein
MRPLYYARASSRPETLVTTNLGSACGDLVGAVKEALPTATPRSASTKPPQEMTALRRIVTDAWMTFGTMRDAWPRLWVIRPFPNPAVQTVG